MLKCTGEDVSGNNVQIRLNLIVKASLVLLLLLVNMLLFGCQSQHRKEEQNAALLLNQLNLSAAQQITHEKNGDLPPTRFPSWQAFWQNRFFALRQSSQDAKRGHISTRQIANADITFIKRKRAELGLPPIE